MSKATEKDAFVLIGVNMDEFDVLGVYPSRDAAKTACSKFCEVNDDVGRTFNYDRYEIYPCAMGAFATSNSQREVI